MRSTACPSPASARGAAVGSVAVAPAFPMHLSRIDADVLILHEPNPWALLSYAAVRPRLPLAIWFHSDVVRPALQYQLFYAPIARPAYRAARRFLVSSPALAEHATALQPFRDRVTVIPFGIDVDAWRPSEAVQRRADAIRRAAGGPIVLFAGRHVPYKGVPVLIEAAAPLDVDVVIAGRWSDARQAGALSPARQAWPGALQFSRRGRRRRAARAARRVRHVRAAVGDARRSLRLRAARGDGVREAGDQHGAADGRALGQRVGPRRARRRRRGAARGDRAPRGRSGARRARWAHTARRAPAPSSRCRRWAIVSWPSATSWPDTRERRGPAAAGPQATDEKQ